MTLTDSPSPSVSTPLPTDPDELEVWLDGQIAELAATLDSALSRIIARAVKAYDALHAPTLTAAPGDPAAFDSMPDQWATLVDDEIAPVVARIYTQSALTAVLTSNAPPNYKALMTPVVNEAALDYSRTATNRLAGAGDNLWRAVRSELTDAVASGASTEDLKASIEKVTGFSEYRSDTIARTETMMSFNAGDNDTARHLGEFGPTEKQWLATMDARTRESHAEADGQVVPIDGDFIVGGVAMPYPGNGPPEEVINCRCTTLHLYPGDTRPDGTTTGEDPLSADLQAPVTPDDEIASWIRSRLDENPDQSAAALIRDWKALGNKVNDKRFRDIMAEVKSGGTGVRPAKVPGAVTRKTSRVVGGAGKLGADPEFRSAVARVEDARWMPNHTTREPGIPGRHGASTPDRYVVNDAGRALNRAVVDVGKHVENRVAEITGRSYADLLSHVAEKNLRTAERGFAIDHAGATLARREYADAIRQALAETREMNGDLELTGYVKGRAALAEATENYPTEWLARIEKHEVKDVGRGYYNYYGRTIALSDPGPTVWLDRNPLYRVATHELGHAMERTNAAIIQAEHTYFWERAAVPPNNLPGSVGFRTWKRSADEWGYDDEWHNPYAGRVYQGAGQSSPYEVLTTGMEQLLGGGNTGQYTGEAMMGEDHVRWILGVLAAL